MFASAFASLARLFSRRPVVKKGTVITMERTPGVGYREYVDGLPSDKGPFYYWDRLVTADPARYAWATATSTTQDTPHVDADMQLDVTSRAADGTPVYQYRLYRDMPV